MIAELLSLISFLCAIVNGAVVLMLYRQFRDLAEVSVTFAGLVIAAIEEQEDGEIQVDPGCLAGVVIHHLDQLTGMTRWMGR